MHSLTCLLKQQPALTLGAEHFVSCDHLPHQIVSSGSSSCGRLNMSASGLVEADVWMQTPGNSFQPSDFWQKVCTDRALHVATVLCRVVLENVKRH